jgi:Family of unknown function (DUF6510)
MEVLGGNAIAGLLFAVFGGEMTTATATCGDCGAKSMVGELGFYLQAPVRSVGVGTAAASSWSLSRLGESRVSTCEVSPRSSGQNESPAVAVAAARTKGEA